MTEYTLAISEVEVQRYRLMAEHAAATEQALWRQAGIVPGAVVADVGCGPAAMSVELARAVAPGGRVLGVERDAEALRAAATVVEQAGADVVLQHGEAGATGIDPGSVDVAVMRHVLAHNGGHEQRIVDHLAELVRPGGGVYLVDVDLTAVRTVDEDPEADDLYQRYTAFHRRRGNDPSVGLQLGRLLRSAGLALLVHQGRYTIIQPPPGVRPPAWAARDAMVAEGLATPDDLARWGRAMERSDAAVVRPTLFAPTFIAIGRRPG